MNYSVIWRLSARITTEEGRYDRSDHNRYGRIAAGQISHRTGGTHNATLLASYIHHIVGDSVFRGGNPLRIDSRVTYDL